MKPLFLVLTLITLAATTAAQKAGSLSSLVETERAFARAATEIGTREAFVAFIAQDGILFRPTAVNGKKWMQDNPLPPSPKRQLLSWQPIFADISLAGDLGYTTGPWEFKEDIKDEKPVAYGNFVTVWKLQSDGSWKFVIDLGITNPAPLNAIIPWQLPAKQNFEKASHKVDIDSARAALLQTEREFSLASGKDGVAKAFLAYAAGEIRLFRNNNFPFLNRSEIGRALGAESVVVAWRPAFADVSRSGDLGYAYGTYEVTNTEGKLSERGNYMRIWKKHKATWRVVLDVANPLPPEKKS